jgi:hypothetical protein
MEQNVRPWSIAIVAAGLIGTVVTVLLAYEPIRTGALWCLGLCVVGPIIFLFFRGIRSRPFNVVYTRTEKDFDAAWHLGMSIYSSMGKHYPDEQLVLEWWRRYPSGILRLIDRCDNIVGYISIWPVSRDTFRQLKSGGLAEDQLESKYIEREGTGPFDYWYIADVCRSKRPVGYSESYPHFVVNYLVGGVLEALVKRDDFPDPVELIAFAVSTPGELLLKRLGFLKVAPTSLRPVVSKIYVRSLTKRGASTLIKDCFAAARESKVI